jgi:hypothetical protein
MKRMIVGVFVGLMALVLAGCQGGNMGDDSTGSTNVSNTTTYNVADGGKVVIFDNEGDITGCYDLDLNGSECNVETHFESTYEVNYTEDQDEEI